MAAAIIEFENVRKAYGAHEVLPGLSLKIAAGEKVALIGPSGSGKTTILRILMTLETITDGIVRIEGEPLLHMERKGQLVPADQRHLARVRRKIGMVFQMFNLFPHMTVLQNVALPQMLTQKVPKSEACARATELLSMVGLAEKSAAWPNQLSGGQKQRVAIARALALRPKIMLFDEVTSALDPELVEEVLNVLRRIGAETDTTMLLVTHEMNFARSFADRVLFLDCGAIVEEGPPERIFFNPAQTRTKAFLRKIVAAGHAL